MRSSWTSSIWDSDNRRARSRTRGSSARPTPSVGLPEVGETVCHSASRTAMSVTSRLPSPLRPRSDTSGVSSGRGRADGADRRQDVRAGSEKRLDEFGSRRLLEQVMADRSVREIDQAAAEDVVEGLEVLVAVLLQQRDDLVADDAEETGERPGRACSPPSGTSGPPGDCGRPARRARRSGGSRSRATDPAGCRRPTLAPGSRRPASTRRIRTGDARRCRGGRSSGPPCSWCR